MDQPANNLLRNKIKTLDGFRGLAVLLLCCYHFFDFLPFTFSSVDLFFVLSGFLITGKLVESLEAKNYFRTFYINRILRVVPLCFAVLLIFFVLIPLLMPSFVSASFRTLLQQQVYYWTFTENISDAVHGWPLNITLIHFWSLACEMQFYLFWPFVVYFLYHNKKLFVITVITIALLGILFRIYAHFFLPLQLAYRHVMLPSRIDAFCAGAILYMAFTTDTLLRYKKIFALIVFLMPCIVLLIMTAAKIPWHFGVDVVSKYGYTINVIFWFALIAFTLSSDSNFCKRFFSSRIMRTAGKYSYGIYVFHLPVYIIIGKQHLFNANEKDKTLLLALVAFLITCLCSFLSYHLLEKHFLRMKPAQQYAKI